VIQALAKLTGNSKARVESEWKKTGDLGEAAENLTSKKKQQTLAREELKARKVFENLKKLAELEGKGTVGKKIGLISEILSSADSKESKFIIRTLLQDLRIGTGEGTLRDAIVWAYFWDKIDAEYDKDNNNIEIKDREVYNKYADAVQRAYDIKNDFSVVAKTAADTGLEGLNRLSLVPGTPIKVMLALKAKNLDDGFERVGKPCQLEYKYDGFRIQAHKKDNKIRLFTRRLDDVTEQFPDIVDALKNIKADSFIIDSEAVGYSKKTGKYLAFQKISQRIKRKYDIKETAKKYPVELNIFDIIYHDGKSMLNSEFKERRKIIEKIVRQEKRRIVVANAIVTDDKKQAEEFYRKALKDGNEGIMMKKLDSVYKPGARVGYMIKIKPTMENLDLVIVKAEYGTGKRGKWLSSFYIAAIDEDSEFKEIGKVSTGLKEKNEEGVSFEEMTKILKPLIIKEEGREAIVKPKIVIEVSYEEIQKSPTYSSGYALRFPRFIGIRDDRDAKDASSLDYIEELYYNQK
jgi:DNA ligase-1